MNGLTVSRVRKYPNGISKCLFETYIGVRPVFRKQTVSITFANILLFTDELKTFHVSVPRTNARDLRY